MRPDKQGAKQRTIMEINLLHGDCLELMKEYEIEWHDETDDFDFHEDYHRFMKRVKGIDVP